MNIRSGVKIIFALTVMLLAYGLINFGISSIAVNAISSSNWGQAFRISAVLLISFLLFSTCLIFFNKWLRAILIIAFALSAITNEVFRRIQSAIVDYDIMVWLLEETNQASNVFQVYANDILIASAIVLSALLIASIAASAIYRQIPINISKRWSRLLSIVGVLGLVFWNIMLLSITAKNHPLESSILAYSITILTTSEHKGGVVTEHHSDPIFNKVVLIVDEAIRYDFFEKLLGEEIKKLNAIDFGEATSTSPCSAASNAILRWGFSIDKQLIAGKDTRENPKIWRYAKAAGFRTHMLDGQTNGPMQNWVGKDERLDIDDLQPLDSGIETDKILARKINSLLRLESRDFIYVVKRGAHWPYDNNYPEIVQSSVKTTSQNYVKAIQYNCSGFLTEALKGVDMKKTLVIYTSDHGQRLDGSGAPHCNTKPHRGEYSVPLLVFTENKQWRRELGQASNAYRNKTMHLQIFSTLLIGFGYDRHQSTKSYFPSLFDSPGSRYILEYPFIPFPTIRTDKPPIRMVANFSEIGDIDNGNDPPVSWIEK